MIQAMKKRVGRRRELIKRLNEEWRPEYSRYTSRARKRPSLPLRTLLERVPLPKNIKILDLGTGQWGKDVQTLRELGYEAYGYDPYWPPWNDESVLKPNAYDVVTNFYVLNVLIPEERPGVIKNAWMLLKPGGKLYVAVRDISDTSIPKSAKKAFDGVMYIRRLKGGRKVKVFQKWYTPEDLISELTGEKEGFESIKGLFPIVRVISKSNPLLVEAVKV